VPQHHVRLLLVRLAARVADQLELHAPRGEEVDPPLALRGVAAGYRPGQDPHALVLEVVDGGVHVIDVEREVVAAQVAVARHRPLVPGRLVLEDLQVEAEGAAVEADLADGRAGIDVQVRGHPVVVVPHPRQRVHVVAAQHVHEELVRLRHVRHGDPHVIAAPQPRYACAQ